MSLFNVPINIKGKTRFTLKTVDYKSILKRKPNDEEILLILRDILRHNHNSKASYERKLKSYFNYLELKYCSTINKSINRFEMFLEDKTIIKLLPHERFFTESTDHKIKLLDLIKYPTDLIYENSYIQDYMIVPCNAVESKLNSYNNCILTREYPINYMKAKYNLQLDVIYGNIFTDNRKSSSLEDTLVYLKNKNNYVKEYGFKRVYELFSHNKLAVHPKLHKLSLKFLEHIDECFRNESIQDIYNYKFKEDDQIECVKFRSPTIFNYNTIEHVIINYIFEDFLFID